MAESRKNVFSMLVDDDGLTVDSYSSKALEVKNDMTESFPEVSDPIKTTETTDDTNWTVQQSNKSSRRLAPQWTLSRNDFGADSSRGKGTATASSTTNNLSTSESSTLVTTGGSVKKKVLRFNREDLLFLRKPTKILESMKEFSDIVSIMPLEPVTSHPLGADEIQRLWNSDRKDGGLNRGRGRGKTHRSDDENNDHDKGGHSESSDIWDDGGGLGNSITFDLADMAAAALKFQSETLTLSSFKDNMPEPEEPAGDEDEVPEWATDDAMPLSSRNQNAEEAANNPTEATAKRALLLETLQVSKPKSDESKKSSPLSEPVEIEVPKAKETNQINDMYFAASDLSVPSFFGGQIAGFTSSLAQPPQQQKNQPQQQQPQSQSQLQSQQSQQVEEWFYTDPQNNIQGPFSTENMRAWNDAGYFSPSLPLKLRNWPSFIPLSTAFPNHVEAFKVKPLFPVAETPVLSYEHQRSLEEQRLHDLNIQRMQEQAAMERMRQAALEKKQHELMLLEQRRQQEFEEKRRQEYAMQQRKQQEILQEQLRNEQAMFEKQRQQALLEQKRQQQQQAQQQQYILEHQAVIEQQRQQQILEQQRQQALAEQHQRQGVIDQRHQVFLDQQRHQMILEHQRQQAVLEQQKQQQEKRRQEQMSQENQRKISEENHRQWQQQQQQQQFSDMQSFDGDRNRIERVEQQRQLEQWMKDNQVRAEQQRSQLQAMEEQMRKEHNALPSSLAPWARSEIQQNKSKETLLEIQRREQEEAAEANRQRELAMKQAALKAGGWGKQPQSISSANKLTDIQLEQENQRRIAVEGMMPAGAGGGQMSTQLKSMLGVQQKPGQWSAASNVNTQYGLREIMEQERRRAMMQEQLGESMPKPPPPGSWAAKASTGLAASPMNIPPVRTAMPRPQMQGQYPDNRKSSESDSFWGSQEKSNVAQIDNSRGHINPADTDSEIMPKEMMEWCELQFKKLNLNIDSELLQLCYSLQSAGDIREYISDYVGSTAQISQFTTEFIRRKEQYMLASSNLKKKRK